MFLCLHIPKQKFYAKFKLISIDGSLKYYDFLIENESTLLQLKQQVDEFINVQIDKKIASHGIKKEVDIVELVIP